MIFIIVTFVWLAIALLGLSMGRLAALSDGSHDVALVEWLATNDLAKLDAVLAYRIAEQLPLDSGRATYRATG